MTDSKGSLDPEGSEAEALARIHGWLTISSRPGRSFSCLVVAIGCIGGMILGGIYGIKRFNEDVEEAIRMHGFADMLPIPLVLWTIVGAFLGVFGAWAFLELWSRNVVTRPKGDES